MAPTTEKATTTVEGSTRLYVRGERRFVPMPTGSPKDPLNLPTRRKCVIIAALCFFGAMASAAEVILAALLPVFILEYAGFDPHILDNITGLPQRAGGGVNPNTNGLLGGLGGPPLWKTTLITTLPVLVIGISNYFLIPLSIAVGRRPVILVCGLLAWCGALWAGASQSLDSHLGARALQALGAGTVEALIPLVVQDMVFINWRNRCFSAVWASQGIIIVTLGICSPIIISETSWRWLYNITAICAALSWVAIIFILPETRFFRSTAELGGEPLEPLPRGFLRPALNPTRYGKRTWWDELGIFVGGFHWARAWDALLASVKSFFFPNIFWVIVLNGLFTAISLSAGQTGAGVLLTTPNSWPFRHIGLAVLPIVVASIFVAIFAGYGADVISNVITKRFHGGRREPEVHLINLIVPLLFAIAGCVMFGAGGSYIGHISWGVFVVGIGFLSFGLLSANVIFSTYVVESYPEWAGPVLVNVASLRNVIGFGFSFKVTSWISQLGFIRMFGVYAGVMALLSLGLIPMYFKGKAIRKYCGKFVWSQEHTFSGIPQKRSDSLLSVDGAGFSVPASKREGQINTVRVKSMGTDTPEEKQGIDWEHVKACLNIRSSWRDPPSH